ncbi:hypothetical protein LCGC14_1283510, partial [marine sediment metagenome]
IFRNDLPLWEYFKARFDELGGMTPAISKRIGWQKEVVMNGEDGTMARESYGVDLKNRAQSIQVYSRQVLGEAQELEDALMGVNDVPSETKEGQSPPSGYLLQALKAVRDTRGNLGSIMVIIMSLKREFGVKDNNPTPEKI